MTYVLFALLSKSLWKQVQNWYLGRRQQADCKDLNVLVSAARERERCPETSTVIRLAQVIITFRSFFFFSVENIQVTEKNNCSAVDKPNWLCFPINNLHSHPDFSSVSIFLCYRESFFFFIWHIHFGVLSDNRIQ
jgi:hypothetical protein